MEIALSAIAELPEKLSTLPIIVPLIPAGLNHAVNALPATRVVEMPMLNLETATDPMTSVFGKSTPLTGLNAVVVLLLVK